MNGMTVNMWPALAEIMKLVLLLGVSITLVTGFVKLNFACWKSKLYLPTMGLISFLFFLYFHIKFDFNYWQEARQILSQPDGWNQAWTALMSPEQMWIVKQEEMINEMPQGWFVRLGLWVDYSALFFMVSLPLAIGSFFRFALKGKYQSPIYFAAPAVAGVFFFFMYPLVFEIYLSFHRLTMDSLGTWIQTGRIESVGIENFINVLSSGSTSGESFWIIFGRTLLWTGVNVSAHVLFGTIIALVLNQKITAVPVYRTIMILPWALPQLIAVLAWRGEFHGEYGYINTLIETINSFISFHWNGDLIKPLEYIGLVPREWWTDSGALFASICIVNIWLGIPFMAVMALSALQSIPLSYYEAASIDGASKWQQFRTITVPLMKPVMIPAIVLGIILTFNAVNVVFLMTSQRGGSEGADILASDLYKQAFSYYRYSFSAAYSLIVFVILLAMTLVWLRISKATESVNART